MTPNPRNDSQLNDAYVFLMCEVDALNTRMIQQMDNLDSLDPLAKDIAYWFLMTDMSDLLFKLCNLLGEVLVAQQGEIARKAMDKIDAILEERKEG